MFALFLHYFPLWLASKTFTTFSTNNKQKKYQSQLAHTYLPMLSARHILLILLWWLHSFGLLWLAGVFPKWLWLKDTLTSQQFSDLRAATHRSYSLHAGTKILKCCDAGDKLDTTFNHIFWVNYCWKNINNIPSLVELFAALRLLYEHHFCTLSNKENIEF